MKRIMLMFLYLLAVLLLLLSGCSNRDYSVTLTWKVPATNTDGSALTDLAGYELSVGPASGKYDRVIWITVEDKLMSCKNTNQNPGKELAVIKCSYTVTGLGQGDYYFVMRAYNAGGKISTHSNEVRKTASR